MFEATRAGTGTTPLLRVFSPARVDHFYTASVAERDTAVAALGYVDEGIACHVYPEPTPAQVTPA